MSFREIFHLTVSCISGGNVCYTRQVAFSNEFRGRMGQVRRDRDRWIERKRKRARDRERQRENEDAEKESERELLQIKLNCNKNTSKLHQMFTQNQINAQKRKNRAIGSLKIIPQKRNSS